MNRTTWRDVFVDVFAILVMVGVVGLGGWTMQACAPWIVAVVAGRWGASTLNKFQALQAASKADKDGPKSSPKPAPDSGIVLVLVLFGGLVAHALKAHFHRGA